MLFSLKNGKKRIKMSDSCGIIRNFVGAMKKKIILLLCLLMSMNVSAQQQHSDAVDDVLQHVPMAAVYGLRVCGVQSDSQSWTEFLATSASAYILSAGTAYVLKHSCNELRPDKSDRRSLPSGHATFAFAGATVLMHEYGHLSPWITVGGYTLATLVSADRVRQDRHYVHDVCAGAAIGIGATELTYWLKRKFIKNRNIDVSFNGFQFDVAVRW